MPSNQTVSSFDVARAITTHIEQRNKLDDYISGKSSEMPPTEFINCHAGCHFAKWLHEQGCEDFRNFHLLNQVCNACEEFQSAASEAVLLVKIGKGEIAREVLWRGGIYTDASAEFQRNLARLHYQLAAAGLSRGMP